MWMIARISLLLLAISSTVAGDPVRSPDVAQYGERGCGKLVVIVSGPIEKYGVHFLPEGATLADLIKAAGKGIPCSTCERVPTAAIIRRVGERSAKQVIHFSKPDLVNEFRLEDRDLVTFVTAHF